MRFYSTLLFICFTGLLFGEIEHSASLASTEGLVNALVGGHVCPISGEFVYSATDLYVPGPSPLVVQRSYTSQNMDIDHLHSSWQLTEPTRLYSFDVPDLANEAVVTTNYGARVKYTWNHSHYELHKPFGYTNCGTTILSGKTNLKNHTLRIEKSPDEHTGILTSGDFTKRVYKNGKSSHGFRSFELVEELKQDRTKKSFSYKNGSIHEIKISHLNGKKFYSKVAFDYHDKKNLVIRSNAGRDAKYTFKEHKYHIQGATRREWFLENVKSDQRPEESYEYESDDVQHWRVSKVCKPESRYLQIKYYKHGKNKVGDRKIDVAFNSDQLNRVMLLLAPNGLDSSPIISHRFFYNFRYDAGLRMIGGTTEVRDALDRRTDYHYNQDLRLETIANYDKSNVYRYDRFFWGPNGSKDEGNLSAKYVQEPSGTHLTGSVFVYDEKGNVRERKEYGKVSGYHYPAIVLGSDGKPIDNGAEHYRYVFYYNDQNQIIRAEEANGKNTTYTYITNTSAIESKIVCFGNSIITREFFEYDENLFLLAIIIDDGKTTSKNDVADVSCRKITRFKPRQTFPFGLNEEVCELYLDRSSGCERQINRVINKHSCDGLLTQQEFYDSNNHLRYTLYWEYDAHGNKTKEIDALGQTILYQYDGNDNLIFKQGPNFDFSTTYAYDYSNRLIKTTEHHPDGNFSTEHRYDMVGNRIKEIDSYGNETLFHYDDLNRLIEVVYPQSENNPISPCEKFEYDILGNITTSIDKNGHATFKQCNIYGKPLVIQYPDGSNESHFYWQEGTLRQSTYKNGSYSHFHRDCLGRLLTETLYDSTGCPLQTTTHTYGSFSILSSIDPEGIVTSYSYDDAGRLTCKLVGTTKTTYEYDTLGRVSKEIQWIDDDTAQVNTFAYDLLNRIIGEGKQDLEGKIFTYTEYTYDSFNQRTSERTGDCVSQTQFDTHQMPIKKIDALGNVTTIIYDYHHKNFLNQIVFKITTIDPLGNQTIEIKDVNGKTSLVQRMNSFNQLLSQFQNIYDADGNLLSVRQDKIVDGKVIEQQLTKWEYNSNGEVTKLIEGCGTPLQRGRSYTYNTCGQKASMTKPDGVVISYQYDSKGRLQTISSSDKTISYTYSYNKNDQVLKVRDNIAKTTTLRDYDLQGRLTHEKLANKLALNFTYDNLGRKTEVELPDHTKITYLYDEFDLTHVIRQGRYEYTHQYIRRDIHGNVLENHLPFKAGNQVFTYDDLKRERINQHPKRSQTISQFDACGNLLHLDQQDALGSLSCKFSYNERYQLTSEETSESHQYRYDSLDNRLQVDSINAQINSLNQVVSDDQHHFHYDLNGNLIAKDSAIYRYDALNRLIEVVTPTATTHYTYDAFDRRLSKNEEHYLYDGQNEIGIYKNHKQHFLRVLGESIEAEIGGTIAIETPLQVLIPLHDHIGNIVTLLTTQGDVFRTYRYTAFGLQSQIDPLDTNPWRFASKHYDSETNLIYFGRRYYDPSLARWISPDPLDYDDGPNLYVYVRNNPLTHFDAYGLVDNPLWEMSNVFCQTVNSGFANACEFAALMAISVGRGTYNGLMNPIETGSSIISSNFQNPLNNQSNSFAENCAFWSERSGEIYGLFINANIVKASATAGIWLTKTAIGSLRSSISKSILKEVAHQETNFMIKKASIEAAKFESGEISTKVACTFAEKQIRISSNVQKASFFQSYVLWTKNSPFKNRTAKELDAMFREKNFRTIGTDPINGKGSYLHPKSGRQYRIDPRVEGRYNTEQNHIDVERLKNFRNLPKKRFSYYDQNPFIE